MRESNEEIKLVQLRNPWGNEYEWNKGWSDRDSKSWDSIRPDEKEKFHTGNISNSIFNEFIILNQFEYFKDAPDGTFWMSWSDFLVEFESLSVCMLPNSK